MKRTPHQVFVESLHKQLNLKGEHRNRLSERDIGSDEIGDNDIALRELERMFDELFGSLDDDDDDD